MVDRIMVAFAAFLIICVMGGSPAQAQPTAIAALIVPIIFSTPLAAIGFTAANAIALGIGYAATAAAMYGINAALAPDAPNTPKAEDGKFNLRQPVPPLSYALGFVRKGGDYVFLEEAGGVAHHITVLCAHSIDGFVEHWLHDEIVTLDESGNVIEPENFTYKSVPRVIINTRLGDDASTAYSQVVTAFPSVWTNDHRGDGLTTVLMRADTVPVNKYQEVFPNQMPQHSAVLRGHDRIYDPRSGTYGYTANLALLRLWHLTHPVGGKLTLDDMYLPEWAHAADVCDETVTDRNDEELPRYHGGLWFRSNNDPVEVGRIMDQAAELVVYERPDGLVGVHAGEFVVPTVRITSDDIIALTFDTNRRRASNVLAVKGQYTSPEQGFSTVDAAVYGDPYIDDTQRIRTIENQAIQHHNHMARLQKITMKRANAPRVTLLVDYQAGKAARTARFIRVHRPPRLDEAIIEIIESPKMSLRNLTIEIQGIVVTGSLYDFDDETDEGLPPTVADPVAGGGLPVPTGFDVVINQEPVVLGGTAAYALATWTEGLSSLDYVLEWEPTAGGPVQTVQAAEGQSSVRTSYLADGAEYRFRLRAISFGKSSEWTDYSLRTAVADPTPPGEPTSLSVTPSGSDVTIDWTQPSSANTYGARVYRHTSNDPGSATMISEQVIGASEPGTYDDESLAAGAYWWWVAAMNGSGIESARTLAGTETIS